MTIVYSASAAADTGAVSFKVAAGFMYHRAVLNSQLWVPAAPISFKAYVHLWEISAGRGI